MIYGRAQMVTRYKNGDGKEMRTDPYAVRPGKIGNAWEPGKAMRIGIMPDSDCTESAEPLWAAIERPPAGRAGP